MTSLQAQRSESTHQSTFFVTKDTYIDNKGDKTDPNYSSFLRIGKGVGDTRTQTLIGNYDYRKLKQDHTVMGVKLCLHQYFAHDDALSIDPFQINLIEEEWDMDVTASTKPRTGEQIATIYFSKTEGKECFQFDISQREKLVNSYGILISGGGSLAKKERYFLSSQWTSRSLNVSTPANSDTYHPHWVITSKFDPQSNTPSNSPSSSNPNPTNTSGQNIPKNPPPLNNQTSNDDDSFLEKIYKSPYLIPILACFICSFIIIVSVLCYRRKRKTIDKKIHKFDPNIESYDDIFSVHEEQLRDIFRAKQNNGYVPKGAIEHGDRFVVTSKPSQPSYAQTLNNSTISSKAMSSKAMSSKAMSSNTMTSNTMSTKIQRKNKNKKKSLKKVNNSEMNTDKDFNQARRHASQKTNKNRDDKEKSDSRYLQSNTSSWSSSTNGGSLATHDILESVPEPCTINKFCLRVVERKECDIDYVAPGVASVVDNQCAAPNIT